LVPDFQDGGHVRRQRAARSPGSGAVRLTGAWRRFAIAWTIQSWGLARSESNGRVLLWRRDVAERLQRLAPFARFGAPAPALRNGALWWVSWVTCRTTRFRWCGRSLARRRCALSPRRLVGAVRGATARPTVACAGVRLTDCGLGASLRAADRARGPAPRRSPGATRLSGRGVQGCCCRLTARQRRLRVQAGWITRPREPYQLGTPDGAVWTAVALESGLPTRSGSWVCARRLSRTWSELRLWRPAPADPSAERLPGELLGSSLLRPGQLRVWPRGIPSSPCRHRSSTRSTRGHDRLRASRCLRHAGRRAGHGLTARAALLGGEQIIPIRRSRHGERARRLAIQADSRSAREIWRVRRLVRQLMSELAPARRPR